MQLNWLKQGQNNERFYLLEGVDLAHSHFDGLEGVYVIWNVLQNVKVGQGVIRDRLRAHLADPNIMGHSVRGPLHVAWAAVSDARTRDGVERYLGDTLRPVVAQRFPDVRPIEVNLPA